MPVLLPGLGSQTPWLFEPRVNAWSAIELLVDDYNDNVIDAGLWPSTTGCSEAGGRAVVPCTAVYQGYQSAKVWSLAGSVASVEVPTLPAIGNGSTEVSLEVVLAGVLGVTTHTFKIIWAGGTLLFREQNAGVNSDTSVAYNATDHRWWRIRDATDTVFWETSPNNTASSVWTVQRSKVPAIPLGPMAAMLVAGFWGAETAPGNAEFDNFNVTTTTNHFLSLSGVGS